MRSSIKSLIVLIASAAVAVGCSSTAPGQGSTPSPASNLASTSASDTTPTGDMSGAAPDSSAEQGNSPATESTVSSEAVTQVASVPNSDLVRPGYFTACVDIPFVPMQYFDSNGDAAGVDIDLMTGVAERLGLKIDPANTEYSTAVAALKARKCDAIWSDQYITADRLKELDMIAYQQSAEALIVPDGNPKGVTGKDELCGLTAAGQVGGLEIDELNALSKACTGAGKKAIVVRQYSKSPQALQALLTGHADVWIASVLTSAAIKQEQPDVKIDIASTFEMTGEGGLVGVSFTKDNAAVRDGVLKALQAMYQDGSFKTAFEQFDIANLMVEPKLAG